MKNKEYWAGRMQALEDENYRRSMDYYKDVQEQFRQASNSLQMDIEHWYRRLAENNGISYASAKRFLKSSELKEFKWEVDQYIKAGHENAIDQRWMKELENASARSHISYLEAMKLQIRQHAELLSTEFEGGVTDFLQKGYAEQFYRTAYEFSKGSGTGFNLARLDERRIDALMKHPWAQDGKNFSDRIWTNREKLISNLHTELAQCIIRGESPGAAISRLAKKMDVSKGQAGNLIMTESAAIASAAQEECYRELGVEQYQFDATLDGATCEICQGMDHKVFRMSEYEVGVTVPPIHPRCRCCTTPYYDDWEEFGISPERAARDPETGKTVYVDGSLKYEDWKSQEFGGKLNETTDKWSREAKEELLQDEKSLSARKKETAVVYDADGNFLFQKRGGESEVSFSRAEAKKLKGCIVSHNHPSGTSFSAQDIVLLHDSKAAEVRVSTVGGAYYLRPPRTWPEEIDTGNKIIAQRKKIEDEVKKECQALYRAGKITKIERFHRLVDETNRKFAERYGLDYGREKYEE